MADGALGQFAQNVFEGVADETKKNLKAAGAQIGVINQKPKNIPTQQQVNALAAQKKVEDEARLSEKRDELAKLQGLSPQESVSTLPQQPIATLTTEQKQAQAQAFMKQEAHVTAQNLGITRKQAPQPPREENPFPEKKAPPPLENIPSKTPFGVKKKTNNIALVDAQRKTEIKSGKLG